MTRSFEPLRWKWHRVTSGKTALGHRAALGALGVLPGLIKPHLTISREEAQVVRRGLRVRESRDRKEKVIRRLTRHGGVEGNHAWGLHPGFVDVALCPPLRRGRRLALQSLARDEAIA